MRPFSPSTTASGLLARLAWPLGLLMAACTALFSVGSLAQEGAKPYQTILPNGLKVVVQEDHRSPTVVHMVWYRVGAIDEVDGSSGLAHVLEHLMFKGTRTLKPGEFNDRVAKAGGRDNAFTSQDYTAYFQQIPKAALPQMMALEADRMANLQFANTEFDKEIQVVMEERRWRTDDQPQALVHEALMSSAFVEHPYRRPVIGWMRDLENMTANDAREWYRRWYHPNNAVVVVVGDVQHEAVFAEARRTYGKIRAATLPTAKPLGEPPQQGIRRVSVKAPAKLPYLAMAWKVPKLSDVNKDREAYALEVLAAVLDGHEAARLGRDLVRAQKVAVSAGAGYDGTQRGEALFYLDGTPSEGHSVVELEAALRTAVREIAERGVTEQELSRVKVQMVASQVYKRDSTMGLAMEIGGAEMTGLGWQNINRVLEQLRSVTPAEVQAVAKKYLVDDQLTVAVLDPQPVDPNAKPRERPAGLLH